MDDDDEYYDESRRRRTAAAAAGRRPPPSPDSYYSSSAWLQVAEVSLRAFLKFLGAIADLVDRILGSVEPRQDQPTISRQFRRPNEDEFAFRRRRQQEEQDEQDERETRHRERGRKSWWWIRFLRWLGDAGLTFLPDRNSFWVVTVLVLVVAFLFVGYRSSFRLYRIVEEVEVPKTHSKRFLQLPDGRSIAYKEHGVSAHKAKHSGLVIQGLVSSSSSSSSSSSGFVANETLLHEFGIRLVSYDLPGFGDSDPHPHMTLDTSSQDMAAIADALGLGDRFWLLVYAGGGPYAWAAIKYIPQRLAGIVMVAPLESPYKEELTSLEPIELVTEESVEWKITLFFARYLPSIARMFIDTKAISNRLAKINKRTYAVAADTEQVLFKQKEFITFWEENLRQSQNKLKKPVSDEAPRLEELLRLLNAGWSFGFTKLLGFPSFKLSFKWLPNMFSGSGATLRPSRPKPTTTFGGDMTPAAAAPDASIYTEQTDTGNDVWQVFKHKFLLVVVVIAILLVVLR